MAILKEVDGAIMVIDRDKIVGCVSRCNETQWEFTALAGGESSKYLPLRYALTEALKYEPKR